MGSLFLYIKVYGRDHPLSDIPMITQLAELPEQLQACHDGGELKLDKESSNLAYNVSLDDGDPLILYSANWGVDLNHKYSRRASANPDFSVSIMNYESPYSATQICHRRP